MTNYFELYGIPESFHPDPAAVKAKFYELSRTHHPDRYAQQGAEAQAGALQLSAANNQAYKTLCDSDATMAYILKLHALLADEEKYALPPAFLMEMMELNEALSDYESEPANELLKNKIAGELRDQLYDWEQTTTPLTSKFDEGERTEPLLLAIKDQYFRKKYLLRIKERIDSFAGL